MSDLATQHAPPALARASTANPVLRRRCVCGGTPAGECGECRRTRLQLWRGPSAATPAVAPPIIHEVLRSSGAPLDAGTRAELEPRFGHSFADVRVHADDRAAGSARAVGAHAYAVGPHVVFGAGRYAPGSADGRRLLAHELAHVVQQRGAASPSLQPRLEVGRADDPAEREADAAAARVTTGADAGPLRAEGAALRRIAVFERYDPLGLEPEAEEETGEAEDGSPGGAAGDTPLFDEPEVAASFGEDAEGAGGEEAEEAGAESGEGTEAEGAAGAAEPDAGEGGLDEGEGVDAAAAGESLDPSLLAAPPNRGRRGRPQNRRPSPAPRRARGGTAPPPVPTTRCTSKVAPDKVVVDHRVSPDRIEKPGDTVTVTATLACIPFSGGKSLFQTKAGASLGLEKFFNATGKFTRTWNGKHQKTSKHRTMMADDGTYIHQIEDLKYAVKGKVDLLATGPKLASPPITVAVRAFKGTGTAHPHFTKANAEFLGKIIRTEIGTGSTAEQEAIAWAVRNQMLRLNLSELKKAAKVFGDHSGKAATTADVALAERILKLPMSGDPTSGAIMWWSPSKFPAPGSPCIVGGVKGDCGGPATSVTNSAGKVVTVQSPPWMDFMARVTVSGVKEWNLILVRP